MKAVLVFFVALIGLIVFLISAASVEMGKDAEAVEAAARIDRCEIDQFGFAKIAVAFDNPLEEEKGYISISVGVEDENGVRIGDAVVAFNDLAPGGSATGETTIGLPEGSANPIRCAVTDTTVL